MIKSYNSYVTNFEKIQISKKQVPNFKEGDSVICTNIDGISVPIEHGKMYKVQKIKKNDKGNYICTIDNCDYYCFRFSTELEYNAKKYNI